MADTSRMKPDFAVYFDGKKLGPEEAGAVIGIRVFQTRFGASATASPTLGTVAAS